MIRVEVAGIEPVPTRLEPSETVGLQREISAGGANLLDSSRCRVDAVNVPRELSDGLDLDNSEGGDPGEVIDVQGEDGELVGDRSGRDERVVGTCSRRAT